MEDAGAAAVVLHSLFEEQINYDSHQLDHFLTSTAHHYAEALTYFPEMTDYGMGPERYLEHVRRSKERLSIPVIASLNGVSSGGWIKYARYIEEAGADALELNIYYIPTDPAMSGAEVERMYLDLVRDVRQHVRIPLAVKIGPFFSSLPHLAKSLADAGADALVLFNRFYQPDLDLEKLEVVSNLTLSDSSELRLRVRWVAILYGRVPLDFALTGGVHTAEDVLKGLMAGANVVMMTSALLKHGVGRLRDVLDHLRLWMEDHEYESVQQMRGSMSQRSVSEPSAFERANYVKVLGSYSTRIY
jgi:dihydroorotate dehydrogenase (fumarate)